MTSILLIGLAITLALYLFLTKTGLARSWRGEPQKAKKQEKAAIMRQLLALSDREQSIPATPPPVRSAKTRTNQRAQPCKLPAEERGFAASSRKP
jgi:hypothetical protein